MDVQNTINALSTIQTVGGVTVAGVQGAWQVTFNQFGNQPDILAVTNDGANVLRGSMGDDFLVGMGGNDYYAFLDGWDHDTVIEDADGGADSLNFFAYLGDTISYSDAPVLHDLYFQLDDDPGGWDTAADTDELTNMVRFTPRQLEYIFGGEGWDSLATLNQNSLFDIDGYPTDTDPLFTPRAFPRMISPEDRNTFHALDEDYYLEFVNVEKLIAGSQIDAFVLYQTMDNFAMYGGPGDDVFIFEKGVGLTDDHGTLESTIDGQGGRDTLNYYCYTTTVFVDLSTGQASNVTANATDRVVGIENLVGGSQDDIFVGDESDNVFIGRDGNDTMTGGLGNDTFVFEEDWGDNDIVVDAEGNDTVSFAGYTITGYTFLSSIRPICDWNCNDLLYFQAAAVDLTFYINTDGIVVEDVSGNSVRYSGNLMENLTGGEGFDDFVFADNATLPGTINGLTGDDTLDYSAYLTGREVLLTSFGDQTGFNGEELSLGIGFENIEDIIGSASVDDSITGMDAIATFTINADINLYTSKNTLTTIDHNLTFTDFEYVQGGGLEDTFNFVATNPEVLEYLGGAGNDFFVLLGTYLNPVIVPGKINGQGGNDTLDYSNWWTISGVDVNLAHTTATAIFGGAVGGVAGVETVIGTDYADILIGDIWANIFYALGGDDLLIGAEVNDILYGGSVSDI